MRFASRDNKTDNKKSAILCVLCVLCGSPAFARNCNPRVIVSSQSATFFNSTVIPQGFIAIPFAVPVAVPSYVQYQAVISGQGPVTSEEKKPEVTASAVVADHRPLATVHCAKCHSGPAPKGKLDLSGELAPAVRLKAIARILADDPQKRMPKGKELDAQAIGLLIQELSKLP